LEKWGARRPTLVVIDPEEIGALKSFRNIPEVTVMAATDVGVADLIGHASLVVSQPALDTLTKRAGGVSRGSSEESELGEDSEE
jgi:ribosomal protein L4